MGTGPITNAVKKLDIDKAVDVGKRLVASTTEMPVEQEIALGDDLTARLLGAMRPLDDPALQSYVNRVGRWLSLQTQRPDLPWRFAVVDTDSLGAFAAPGGNVVITAGLMRLMRDENELAGVLGHEIAHVVDKHHVKAIMKQARVALARDVAANMASEYVSKNPLVTEALLGAGMKIYSTGLGRADEFAADNGGTMIAARAGYDPLGLLLVLTTLDSIDAAEPRSSLMFSPIRRPESASTAWLRWPTIRPPHPAVRCAIQRGLQMFRRVYFRHSARVRLGILFHIKN